MAAIDLFAGMGDDLVSSPKHAALVTPSDTAELEYVATALLVGLPGDIKVTTLGGETLTIPNVPAGPLLLRVKQVWAAGTTADKITVVW